MKHFVERTCTVVRGHDEKRGRQNLSSPSNEAESRTLESFREEPAYVLLGPPGSGKTKAFKREAQQQGGHYVTARDFLAFDPDSKVEGRTIYIDGLDESRAGTSDGRTPFDGIRAKLLSAGRPQFRLSCREADWFGANDRVRLKAVAPNGEVLVLRLDPLSDQGILDILRTNLRRQDPEGFVAAARQRGIDGLLRYPLNLEMLSAAVRDSAWPRTRTRTFDLACGKLASEENPEHQIAPGGTGNPAALLDAAGDLCAILLLAGKAGVTVAGTGRDTDHPLLEHVPQGDPQLFRRVVGTNLFALSAEGRLVPSHRQLAEFLAARRLAKLVAKGLPVSRVLALMTGFDGGIVSEFRGLAAWLAAHSKPARDEIIARDPFGVVLYGDVEDFSAHEKTLVLTTLREETERNPWLVGQITLDSPLGRLADPELADAFISALSDPARDEAHQSFVFLILDAIRSGQIVPGVAGPLMAIVEDSSWPMMHRCVALAAYVRVRGGDEQVAITLQKLLDDVYNGVVPAHDDDLLGTLLTELYPNDLQAADLVQYLREPARRNRWTSYGRFWTNGVIEQSTIEQMVQVLALLREPMEKARAESRVSRWGSRFVTQPPALLLRHILEHSPESIPQEQLLYWLDFAGWLGEELRIGVPGAVSDAEFLGKWLSNRPDTQKEIIARGIDNLPEDGQLFSHMHDVQRSLFGARKPEDYGEWCADQALVAGNDEIAAWFVREAAAFIYDTEDRGLQQRDGVVAKLRVDARLSERFGRTLCALEDHDDITAGLDAPRTPPVPPEGRFDEVRATVRANLESLRDNQCPPGLLHHLAVAYLDGFSDVRGETPQERLRYLLGPNDDLLSAALAGLRGVIHRADLPTWTEVSKLAAEDRTHYLAYPFMVGLEELARAENEDLRLTEAQTRLALSIHIAVPRLRHVYGTEEGPPRWLRTSVARQPDAVAEVWSHCARDQLRKGAELLPDIYYLARQAENAPLASAVSIPLLRVFPIRCRSGQLATILSSLLQAAVLYGDRTQLLELIEEKLARTSMNASQRVYWLAAGLFVEPEAYGDRLKLYVSGPRRGRRIHRLMEMTVERHALPPAVRDLWDATTLETLIRLIGPYSVAPPDTGEVYSPTLAMQADWSMHGFIDRLSKDASNAARNALESLAADDRLANWRTKLLDALHQQKSVHREATFVHPGLEGVAEVLANRRPAGVADLWALATDILEKLARDILDRTTPDRRDYWNVDKYNRELSPKPENGCRDRLLADLEKALAPLGVKVAKEGSYADDKRSDIRLSEPGHPGYNVPIEIKRSCHRELWSAIHTQLIAKYTRHPGAAGYGIYLVFWFGEAEGCRPTPRSGPGPKSATELRQALIDNLTPRERRKISVSVIDVSKPKD